MTSSRPSKSKKIILRSVIALGLVLGCVSAVKREDFKTCSQSGFCIRNRAYAELAKETPNWASPFQLIPSTLKLQKGVLTGELINTLEDKHPSPRPGLSFELHLLENDAVRVRIDERDPVSPRYDGVQDTVLIKSYDFAKDSTYKRLDKDADGVLTIQYGTHNQNKIKVSSAPFKIEFLVNDIPTVVLNNEGLLRFERLRKKEDEENKLVDQGVDSEEGDVKIEKSSLELKLEESLWEERFKDNTDSKPRGPESIGLDITFSGINHVYGVPEHATSLSLKATKGTGAPYSEPYRLYNLDVFEYEIDNPMALYGSIPFMLGHSKNSTAAVFWMNAAETWVDVEKNAEDKDSSLLSWITSKKIVSTPATKTHWISEAGVLDLFVFLGPTHRDIFRQYSSLVGTTALPQSFSIAYHQCRWNYNSQQDVSEVDAGFDEYDIPYDVLWLDIEHTDGKRYFTWDNAKFPNPVDMQQSLEAKGRKMVTIIDPHIKKDDNYHVSKEGAELDVYIKNKDGAAFDGWCWPGSSQWIDFYNPKARDWWASQFSYDRYIGSTKSLFTWNDMNEPSVFNGPEITIPKDVIHYGNVEHRNVHNLYGTMFHSATAQGLTQRNETNQRPFVLSRAFFAGTQRFGAIWTGDNTASWEHLEIASPMLLTIGISGLPFSGADVGGFFGNPDAELLARWYQAGIYYPFFRAHAHIDSKRREPWLFGEPYTSQIREAVRTRYTLLPFWYTLFHEASIDGTPIIRQFPEDEAVFAMDDQYMVGDALLVKPVSKPGVTRSTVYFAGNEKWFDIKDYSVEQGPGAKEVASPADKIPVYQRAGTIIPKRERPRRSSKAMENDPFTLVIALDSQGEATGRIYLDDGETFNYEQGDYIWREFRVSNGLLSSRNLKADQLGKVTEFVQRIGALRIERLVILGSNTKLTKATVNSGSVAEVDCSKALIGGSYVCTVKEPHVAIGEDFELSFVMDPDTESLLVSTCLALGGYEDISEDMNDDRQVYIMGDECLGCLKDIKKFIKYFDEPGNNVVLTFLGKLGILEKDLIPIMLLNSPPNNPVKERLVLACIEVIVPMTWIIDYKELQTLVTMEEDHSMVGNLHQRLEILRGYKRAFLKPGVLQTVFAVLLRPLEVEYRMRTTRDQAIIRLGLSLFRNLVAIPDAESSVSGTMDQFISSIMQEELLLRFQEESIMALLITLASSSSDPQLSEFNAMTLEIFYYIFTGITVEDLIPTVTGRVKNSQLQELLMKEEREKKTVSTAGRKRHDRFGTTGEVRLQVHSVKKPRARTKRNKETDDYKKTVTKSGLGVLRSLALTLLESCFNPLFESMRGDIDMEREKIKAHHRTQYYSLMAFLLRFQRQYLDYVNKEYAELKKNATPGQLTSLEEEYRKNILQCDFDLVTSAIEVKCVFQIIGYMRRLNEEQYKDRQWDEIRKTMNCLQEIVMTLHLMFKSPNETYRDTSDIVQNNLYYQDAYLEVFQELSKRYTKQSIGYLHTLISMIHILLKTLETYSNSKSYMFTRKRKRAMAKKKKEEYEKGLERAKKTNKGQDEIEGGPENGVQQEDEEGDQAQENENGDEEEGQDETALTMRDHQFKFKDYQRGFATEAVIDTYCTFLEDFEELDETQLHWAASLFHRVAVNAGNIAVFYKLSTLHLFHRILQSGKEETKRDMVPFVSYVIHQFFKKMQEYPLLVVEALFPRSNKVCLDINVGREEVEKEQRAQEGKKEKR
ncbi:hypothetical protein BGZ49_001354 [Haplosporangium sp. Z 27]|nr:hypothetical protein BGZ49_001354 [Haplosporangium sp. Z 27]